jgi:hypothetical protein
VTAKKREPKPTASDARSTAVTCAWCGATADPMPPTWSMSTTERGRPEHMCEVCARQNIRSIEGRLDSAWW